MKALRSVPARLLAAIAVAAALTGCSGTDRPKPQVFLRTAVDTVPPGARCRATGAGDRPGRTVESPGLLALADLTPPIRIVCRLPGYWPAEMRLLPRERRPLLERLLAGEPVHPGRGEVRGKAAGVGGEYPARVSMRLARDAFDSERDRDAFYEGLVGEVRAGWHRLREQAEAECAAGVVPLAGASSVSLPSACRRAYEALDKRMRDDLQRIEGERRRAVVP